MLKSPVLLATAALGVMLAIGATTSSMAASASRPTTSSMAASAQTGTGDASLILVRGGGGGGGGGGGHGGGGGGHGGGFGGGHGGFGGQASGVMASMAVEAMGVGWGSMITARLPVRQGIVFLLVIECSVLNPGLANERGPDSNAKGFGRSASAASCT